MEDPLIVLRSAIAAGKKPKLVDGAGNETEDITKAESLEFSSVPGISEETIKFALDQETRFESKDPESKMLDLRTVYNCYVTREMGMTEYITESGERGIYNLKFLERTDLITWLEGASSESDYIKSAKSDAVSSSAKDAGADKRSSGSSLKRPREVDPELQRIYDHERSLVNHNIALRGNKMISFESVSSECRLKIIGEYKSKARQASQKSSANALPTPASRESSSKQRKDPIIILSPSASALLNMQNVKQFLENGVYEYNQSMSGLSDVNYVKRTSTRLGGTVKLLVVNSVEKFKPEYWDRVVGVFVTGQPWQLKPYKWSDPNILFQKVQGFALVFKGDPIPPTLKQWNVDVVPIDRNQRFKDSEVVERIWDKIETALKKRGYGDKYVK